MDINQLNVLFVGDMSKTARSSLWFKVIQSQVKTATAICYERLNDEGEKIIYRDLITRVRWKLGIPKDIMGINKAIREQVRVDKPDILWVLKAPMVWPSTLRYVRKQCPECKIVFYSEDDMYARHNRTQFFIKAFLILTLFLPLRATMPTRKNYLLWEHVG